ncbi:MULTISPECIES: PLDc N-terminal domain-containing protein [unclassified Curtobacterium]|uniref:PLDc N-terminal domain-containing protein n=1 Tax=unclassified Curtobacterium TaxID=257496 RepID=UPI0008DD4CE1|nr:MULTISPECIES: PLDc N-terminal domain-containing protein [unclassified Curtobacterium]OIH92986.1 hypothetical protein BIU92_08885 [Curtobacterium sp. MCBA15_003]OII12197.1 hypothetical protein BIU97_04170 [Curtobacterium sp. MCBA15_009]OII29899.1 hypothetical protein BIU94_09625 [Curtobacterium sp. MMLR14_006]
MFAQLSGGHVVVSLVFLLLEAATLVLLWRDRTRSRLAKTVWTVVVLAIPGIGMLGFLVNWALGRLVARLDRSGDAA